MNEFIDIFSGTDVETVSTAVQLLILLTIFSIAPGILILMTSFARIIIVLSFTRTSLATQQMPPNQVLIGIALFITFFVMSPTFQEINQEALQPMMNEEIELVEAYDHATVPIKYFMADHTRKQDLKLILNYTNTEGRESVIDMTVASILMSMGMMMLPPVMISLPFKILLFVLVDGWHLIVESLLSSFY